VKGGVCVGRTSDDGMEIVENPVTVDDLFQTICNRLTIDPNEEMYTPEGRPVKVVDSGTPIAPLIS
jgi:hydrogenase maturation factor